MSKTCQKYGQRVQNSVFECLIDYGTFLTLKKDLLEIINKETDSLRFYHLGNKWDCKVEHVGAKAGFNFNEPIIL